MPSEMVDLFPVPHQPGLFAPSASHQTMVYDKARTWAYRRAIARTVRPGDVAVDIGTGTGLLAFLCARAGARRVHAIERFPGVLAWAEELARVNGLADRITFHRGDSRSITLPEKAQVIVSELIGYLAFEEGIIDTLLDARERFLAPGGTIIPRVLTLFAVPVSERRAYPAYVDAWGRAEGLDYTPMRGHALRALYQTWLAPGDLLARPQPVFTADFRQGRRPERRVESRFPATAAGLVNGVGLWFGTTLADGVHLASSPFWMTHWGQSFAPIASPIRVRAGDVLRVVLHLEFPDPRGEGCAFAVQVSKEPPGRA